MKEPDDLPCVDFGKKLRALRLQADITTQRELTEQLADKGLYYDYTVVSHWESGRRCPPLEVLIAIIRVLVEAGGIRDVATANELLRLANMRNLNEEEVAQMFGDVASIAEIESSVLTFEDNDQFYLSPSPVVMPSFWSFKAYHRLIGRFEELDCAMGALRDPKSKPMIAIEGLGGIGKTALSLELMERCRQERLFEHIVWSSAKPEYFTGEVAIKTGISAYNLDTLLSDIGRQCERLDISQMPVGQKQAAVKYLLEKKRVLIVIDNLETVPESDRLVRAIFQILGQSKLLITSRHHVKHERVFTMRLSGFPQDEGVTFLREESEQRGVEAIVRASRVDLVKIHQATGGAPLAMKLVVGQMYRQPMDIVLVILQRASFTGQDYPFYRFVYRHSWEMLDMNGRMVLVDMSVFPPLTGGAVGDVQVVSQVESSTFWPAMDQLVVMSLVDKIGIAGQERFALHPLTQYFIKSDITREWAER